MLCCAGKLTSSKELARKLERVKPYLSQGDHSGGITLSGGEPLLQVRALPFRTALPLVRLLHVSAPPAPGGSLGPATCGGGMPGAHLPCCRALQPEFTAAVLMEAHTRGLTTCIDTTGEAPARCRPGRVTRREDAQGMQATGMLAQGWLAPGPSGMPGCLSRC